MKAVRTPLSLLFFILCITLPGTGTLLAHEDCPRVETYITTDSTGKLVIVNRIIPCDGESIDETRWYDVQDNLGTHPERDYSTSNPHVDPDEISIVISAYDLLRRSLDEARSGLTKMEIAVAELIYKSSSKKKIYEAELKLNKLRAYERKLSSDLNFLTETIFIMLSNHAVKQEIQMNPIDK
jgi:hypothetical protein